MKEEIKQSTKQAIIDRITEKIMRVLIETPSIPYNKKALAEKAGVSREALYMRWDSMV